MQHKNTSQCKIITVPAGFASRNIVHLKKKQCTFCHFLLYILHGICEADYITIDKTYTTRINVPVACFKNIL